MNKMFILAFLTSFIIYSWAYTCLDDSGQSVDWFIALKLPNSYRYIYMDSVNTTNWTLSDKEINKREGFFYHTLSQIYQNKNDGQSLHLMYNDHPPYQRAAPPKYGHMKGVVSFKRNQTGFWIVHSAPENPGKYKYSYHKNAKKFGQSFFCSTFRYNALENITEQILIGRPKVYLCLKNSNDIQNDFPNVRNLCEPPESSVEQNSVELKPNFHHIGKSSQFGEDLYSGLVAPYFERSFYVETWLRRNKLSSNCSTNYQVLNVMNIKLHGEIFKNTQDHSKWAVSINGSVVCIGDINREESQFKRGGGVLCIDDENVARNFGTLVKDHTACPQFWEE